VLSAIMMFGDWFIPFFGALARSQQLAAALLIACLSVARSPSSAIAIISELNAKGPFTTVVLAVTVMMDVVVVVLFTITLLIAQALDQQALKSNEVAGLAADAKAPDSPNVVLTVLASFGTRVVLSALLGFALGHALPLIFGWSPPPRSWPNGAAPLRTIALAAAAITFRSAYVGFQ
jgi:Kef-type K+ transport system membrane component KefB